MDFLEYLICESEESDEWLEDYISLDTHSRKPNSDITNELIQDYPWERDDYVYRGLNFTNVEQYNTFIENTKNGTVLDTDTISSWSPDIKIAKQFAITRPTFMGGGSLIQAEVQRDQNKDYMIGFAGVILKTKIPQGNGIDVSRSNYEKESEVIAIPGTYDISIVNTHIPYMRGITVTNYEQELQAIKSLADPDDLLKFEHIMFRFSDYSEVSKNKIMELVGDTGDIRPLFEVKDHRPLYDVTVYCGASINTKIGYCYKFLPEQKQRSIKQQCIQTIRILHNKLRLFFKTTDVDITNITINKVGGLSLCEMIAEMSIDSETNTQYMKKYHDMNSNIRQNFKKLSPTDQNKYIKQYILDMQKILKPITYKMPSGVNKFYAG